jgi:hypothetical protein
MNSDINSANVCRLTSVSVRSENKWTEVNKLPRLLFAVITGIVRHNIDIEVIASEGAGGLWHTSN